MKKSEYIEKRRAYWAEFHGPHLLRDGWKAERAARANAEGDVEAAEAAGVSWDPEEPELPARLCVKGAASYEAALGDASTSEYLSQRVFAQLVPVLVATYNAWGPQGEKREELRDLAVQADTAQLYGSFCALRIRAILEDPS